MSNTALKGYTTPATSSEAGTWGADLNANFQGIVDSNMAGLLTLSLSASNYTITASDAQKAMFSLTGTLLANIVLSPDVSALFNGFYYWENVTTGSFTITVTTGAGSVALPQSRRGVMFVDSTNGPRIMGIAGTLADPIPVGSKTIWYAPAAPAGWSAVAINDYAVQIVNSGGGGVLTGSVPYSTLFGRTVTDDHTLTTNEMPSHGHPYTKFGGAGTQLGTAGGGSFFTDTTGLTGGGAAHSHGLDMRVQTASFTICSKN